MNPTGPNEDFQSSKVREHAENIYNAMSKQLVAAIVETLGLVKNEEDGVDPLSMEFDYAYQKLKEAGYALDHDVKTDTDGKQIFTIRIFQKVRAFKYEISATSDVSVKEIGQEGNNVM